MTWWGCGRAQSDNNPGYFIFTQTHKIFPPILSTACAEEGNEVCYLLDKKSALYCLELLNRIGVGPSTVRDHRERFTVKWFGFFLYWYPDHDVVWQPSPLYQVLLMITISHNVTTFSVEFSPKLSVKWMSLISQTFVLFSPHRKLLIVTLTRGREGERREM